MPGIQRKKVIIMGAAGRDFHNFNVYFEDNPYYDVVCFTAAQIEGLGKRTYPQELAGEFYKKSIPILPESQLTDLIKKMDIDIVVLAYSDLENEEVMHKAARVLAAGADFRLMGPKSTMLKSTKPVIAVCAVRTGVGKSQVSQKIARIMKEKGKKIGIVRHPMPYGELTKQTVEKFTSYADLDKYKATIEEREEYERYIDFGMSIYAGEDYQLILNLAEKENELILWDGGNNDFPFFKPDLLFTLVDPHRVGHETSFYPGETNLLMADVVIINKVNTADEKDVEQLKRNVKAANPTAQIIMANSVITVDKPELIEGKKVLVVEDGPTLTHGGMSFGAAKIAAQTNNAKEICDPREAAVGSIKKIFEMFPHLGNVLPAMGYTKDQIKELELTINNSDCEVVVLGTPADLSRVLDVDKPIARVTYDIEEIGTPTIEQILKKRGFI